MMESQNKYNESRNLDTYSRSHIGEGRGELYDKKMFSEHTYSYAVWQLEKIILDKIIDKERRDSFLDFACGTGRVAEHLEGKFEESFGLDISADMVIAAQSKLKKTRLLVKDVTKDDINFLANKFDVITSFRFFLNAEQDLKIKVLNSLGRLINDNGCIIFNIHQHIRSLDYLIEKARNIFNYKYNNTCNWMSKGDINEMLKNSGFKIVGIYSYTFLPRFFLKLFSFRWWFPLEKLFVSQKHHWGSHLIIVCKKMNI